MGQVKFGWMKLTALSLLNNLQLETYSLGFRKMPSNNNTIQPTLRSVYFSTNFCNKFTSIHYKIATNSPTNLACAQSELNNRPRDNHNNLQFAP